MPKIEKRIDLRGSERTLPPGSRKIGPCDPQEQIQVTVFLRRGGSPKQFPDVTKIGKLPPARRRHLSRTQFASRHGARPADVKKIRTFAAQNKLKVVDVSRPRRSVLLSGSVAAFSRAFGVDLNTYQHGAGTSRMRSGSIQIPATLSGIVEGVFGLDNRPQAKPHFRIRKQARNATRANAASASYNAPQVAQAYDFPAGTTGSGQTIGILELSGGYNATDLATYFKNLGIATPTVTAVSVDGATNSPTGDPNGPDGEVELDIEVSGAVAPSAQIAMYFAPNTDQGFLDALTTAVHDSKLQPSVVSISWGGPESSWTQQALTSFNSACEDASTIGVTILVASGDDGSTDGASSGTATVDFPGLQSLRPRLRRHETHALRHKNFQRTSLERTIRKRRRHGGRRQPILRATELSAKCKCPESSERFHRPRRSGRCRRRRSRNRLQRSGRWPTNRNRRHERRSPALGRSAGTYQSVAQEKCRLPESIALHEKSRSHAARYYGWQ